MTILRRLLPFCLAGMLLLTPSAGAAAAEPSVSLPVLMYHHIHENPRRLGDYTVSPDQFRGDLAWLAAHGYTSVTADEILAYADGEGGLPRKPVLITFDDGQESFAAYAVPILREYGMHAVLAVVGEYADAFTAHPDHDVRYSYCSWTVLRGLEALPEAELAVHSYALHGCKAREGCRIRPGEDPAAYRAMLRQDLALAEQDFRAHGLPVPRVFAYPFGAKCPEAREELTARGYRLLLTCESRVNRLTRSPGQVIELGRFRRAASDNRETLFGGWES